MDIRGDDINMCKALEELKQDWKQEGILLGKAEAYESNIKTMYKNGFDEALISKALDLDVEYVKSVLSK